MFKPPRSRFQTLMIFPQSHFSRSRIARAASRKDKTKLSFASSVPFFADIAHYVRVNGYGWRLD